MGVDILDIHSNRTTLKQTPLPLDHRQRKAIALAALQGANITQLAKTYGVSRKFIYTQKKKALDAINQTFTEEEKQKEKVLFEIKMTKSLLAQLILAMVLCGRSSYRGIQRIIEDVFDYHVSLGKISGIVTQASQKVVGGFRPSPRNGLFQKRINHKSITSCLT